MVITLQQHAIYIVLVFKYQQCQLWLAQFIFLKMEINYVLLHCLQLKQKIHHIQLVILLQKVITQHLSKLAVLVFLEQKSQLVFHAMELWAQVVHQLH